MLTDDGEVKILDFGLAKMSADAGAGTRPAGAEATILAGDQTRDGEIAGTPLYMAPETLMGAEASRRSDVYSAGVVLHELCVGVTPRELLPADSPVETWVEGMAGPVSARAPTLDPRLAAIIDRCLVADPALRFPSADALADALAATVTEPLGAEIPPGNPYRGLRAFNVEDRALFFGRSAETRAVVDRLRADGIVVVTGDSGVGKSSLCRAGVLPLVEEGALGDGRLTRCCTMIPGRRPLAALAAAISPILSLTEDTLPAFEPTATARGIRGALGAQRGLLLFVDQLEELATLSDPAEAAAFSSFLGQVHAPGAGVRVLVTVRGDFFTRLATLPGLGEEISRALYLLRPLTAEGVRAAITGPALRRGVTFEPESMVDDLAAAGTAGGLPLLQFALAELWEARGDSPRLTADALAAIGGVEGALARHADHVLAGLSADAQRAACRALLALVTSEGTRARRTAAELHTETSAARAALDALIAGRLLVASQAEGTTTYELAHEALVDRWRTLRDLLDEGGARRAQIERVEIAAAEWERLGRAPDALWAGKRLEEVRALELGDLSERAASLIAASRAHARRERARRIGLILAGPLALLSALGGLRWKGIRDLDRLIAGHVGAAQEARSLGKARQAEADARRARAYALFDGATGATAEEVTAKKEEAERVWTEALSLAKEAEGQLLRAGHSLEAALALDPGRAPIRGAIGDVTLERIALAESFHMDERRADLLVRLQAYDADGSRRARLRAAPALSVQTTPPGATVLLERYEERQGKQVFVSLGELGITPLREAPIDAGPGSYRLTLRAGGHAEVRYPVLLAPGERFTAEVVLPAAGEVPEGYVHVPAGRFLVGSAEPESLRKGFVLSPPIHEAHTGAFHIARTELTFGEWIAFLDALPPEERGKHTPSLRLRMWGVELKQIEGGVWQLALTLSTARHEARLGEPIRLPARRKRPEIRWERLPVTGISLQDAEAYFRWLDATGRVPRARPCTEWEWERAARGADARLFPHGDVLAADDADFDETYARDPKALGPDEVGIHPASESPFGAWDMIGNVYEVMHSNGPPGEAVMRGGAWYYDAMSGMIPNRTMGADTTRDHLMGVRACADARPR
jgi:formylglycine-generating enzyme required for sulfatase activity